MRSTLFLLIFFFVMLMGRSLKASDRPVIKKLNWGGIEVVWLPDERFPTYTLTTYFADGALSDIKNKGETEAMFAMLTSGTNRLSQKEINEQLEFYGVSQQANVTHEFATYTVSGLTKDILPTFKLICEMFSNTIFSEEELSKEKKRAISELQSLVNGHSALASRISREVSLEGTPYSYPTSGKLEDIKSLSSSGLKEKLAHFRDKVRKRIYLTGPKDALKIAPTLANECLWKNTKDSFSRQIEGTYPQLTSPQITLVTVPEANQAQIRIARLMNKSELNRPDLTELTTGFIGGGFTSRLMQEVRVKRGLSYSIGANAAAQKNYGRVVISTFTKNETSQEIIKVIKETLEGVSKGNFTDEQFRLSMGNQVGGHPFRFEDSASFLSELVMLDHVGRGYDELFDYQENVSKLTREDVSKHSAELFDWNKFHIVVVGNKSLVGTLKKIGAVRVVDYKKYL